MYTEDPNNELSKPLKCGYDPYTNEWEEWSSHPAKQHAIDFYDMREIANARQAGLEADRREEEAVGAR